MMYLAICISIHRKNSQDILGWKKSKKVEESYKKLFTDGDVIENITTTAFSYLNTASDNVFSDMYIYTAAVCDIILNPDNPTIEVLKKSLELRMRRFKVFVEFTFYFKIINQKLIFLGSFRRKSTT